MLFGSDRPRPFRTIFATPLSRFRAACPVVATKTLFGVNRTNVDPKISAFLASENFAAVWLPGIIVTVTVLFKAISRSDRFGLFAKGDLAVGIDLAVASIFAFATHLGLVAKKCADPNIVASVNEQNLLRDAPWVLIAMLVGLVLVTLVTRTLGWKTSGEMAWFGGIIFPFLYGVVSLSVVARLIAS